MKEMTLPVKALYDIPKRFESPDFGGDVETVCAMQDLFLCCMRGLQIDAIIALQSVLESHLGWPPRDIERIELVDLIRYSTKLANGLHSRNA